jgi:DNA-binding transcriptional MerR regulator
MRKAARLERRTKVDRAVRDAVSQQTYTSNEVARLAQVTARQLQWWDERGLVAPYKQRHKRLYKPSEAIEIMIMAELRRKGVSLNEIRQVLPSIKREMDKRLRTRGENEAELYLVTDMKSIHLEHRVEVLIELYKKARHPLLLVCISDQRKQLESVGGTQRAESQLKLFE